MKTYLRVLIVFLIFVVAAAPTFEYVYASIHQDCSCCKSKCQGEKKCHGTTEACLCRYAAPFQVYLFKSEYFSKLVFAGFFAQTLSFSYAYLFKEDIFHPPKTKFS